MRPIAWVIAGVIALHLGAFWLVAGKHFLPKVRRAPPREPAVNFAAGQRTTVDPATGEKVLERDYVVSTRLRPAPAPAK